MNRLGGLTTECRRVSKERCMHVHVDPRSDGRAISRAHFHCHNALQQHLDENKLENSESWNELPQEQRNRMVAAARFALMEIDPIAEEQQDSRRYFAKPGEAGWGC